MNTPTNLDLDYSMISPEDLGLFTQKAHKIIFEQTLITILNCMQELVFDDQIEACFTICAPNKNNSHAEALSQGSFGMFQSKDHTLAISFKDSNGSYTKPVDVVNAYAQQHAKDPNSKTTTLLYVVVYMVGKSSILSNKFLNDGFLIDKSSFEDFLKKAMPENLYIARQHHLLSCSTAPAVSVSQKGLKI